MSGLEIAGFALSAFPVAIQLARMGYDAAETVREFAHYQDGLKTVARDLVIQNALFHGGYNKLREVDPSFPPLEDVIDAVATDLQPGSAAFVSWVQDFLNAGAQWTALEGGLEIILEVVREICSELQGLVLALRDLGSNSTIRRGWSRVNFVLAKNTRNSRLLNLQCLVAHFRELVKDRKAELKINAALPTAIVSLEVISALKSYRDNIERLCKTVCRSWGCQCGNHTISVQLTQLGLGIESLEESYVLCTNEPTISSVSRLDEFQVERNHDQQLAVAIHHINSTFITEQTTGLQLRLRHKRGSVKRITELSDSIFSTWHGQSLRVRIYNQSARAGQYGHSNVDDAQLCSTFRRWTNPELSNNRFISLEDDDKMFQLSADVTISCPLSPISLLDALKRPNDEGRTLFYEGSKLRVGLQIASSAFWLMTEPFSFPTPVDVTSILFYPNIKNGLFDWNALRQSYAEVSHSASSQRQHLTMRTALLSLGTTLYQLLENRVIEERSDIVKLIASIQLDRHVPPWRSVLDHCFYPERYDVPSIILEDEEIDIDLFVQYVYMNVIFPLAKAVAVAESLPGM